MTTTEPRALPNADDKAALKVIATDIIQTCPSLQDCAHEVASDLLKKYAITGLDPDQVYFHRFDASQSSSKAFTGWEHVHARPTASMTLTELVTHRFRVADQDNADLLDVYAGFYSVGADADTYNETNEVRLHGNDVLRDFWSIDFSAFYNGRLSTFWNKSATDFRTLAKCNFLLSAVRARDLRQLSDEDFRFICEAAIGPITWPVTLQLLQSEQPGNDRIRAFDIAGYVATDLLRFVAPKGRHILYLPGETAAFQVLETATDLHFWVLQRMNKEEVRQDFMRHFALADRQKIAEGLTDLMNQLVKTWGRYEHHLINQRNQIIEGDAFSWLRDSTRTAMFAEAALSLTSNGDLRKKLWIGYLGAGVKILGPMAMVGWPVALPAVGASIASMGLNIDQAVNGRTAADRKAGIVGAVLAGIDLLFNLAVLKGPGSLEDVGPAVDAAEAQDMADLKGPPQAASTDTPGPLPTGSRPLFPEPIEELSEFDLARARAYYTLNPPLPRVPPLMSQVETTVDLLDSVFAEKNGLVIGESRGSIGSKQLLIEHMPDLAERGVKTLYLQRLLSNVNQLDLDAFARTGDMSQELESYLQKLDFMAGNDPDGEFNLQSLVREADAWQIRVQAIDSSTTFNMDTNADWQPDYRMARSFFASETINANEEINGPGKWVALVDQDNMTTFGGYRGISEQTGATSLRIDDVAPGQTQSVGADPGLLVEHDDLPDAFSHEPSPAGNQNELIQADWRVQSPTLWATRSPQDLHALLPEPGMFTFQRYRNSVLVVYRNAQGRLADSVVRFTPGGRINLETPMRPAHDATTVDTLDELKDALIEKGMQPMGWPSAADALDTLATDLGSTVPDIEQPVIPQNWHANELLDALTPGRAPGKFYGVYSLSSNPANAIMINDGAYYVRYEPDANGGGTWAIIDPEQPNAFSGSMPVRLNDQGEWQLTPRGGLKGGGNIHPGRSRTRVRTLPQPAAPQTPVPAAPQPGRSLPSVPGETPSGSSSPLTQYDTQYRTSLRKVAFGRREYHIRIVRQPDGTIRRISAYDEYVAPKRTSLLKDTREFFFTREGMSRPLPARPNLARVMTSTSTQELIERVFSEAPGLVIGESQDRIASMQFLLENMPALATQEVKTLYFHRLLNDFNQLDLDEFFNTGRMDSDLQACLDDLQNDPSGRFTPLAVVKAARTNGIRVQATDCMASYRFPGPSMSDLEEQAIKTYLTHTLMDADKALNGAGKWVVLTDQDSVNTLRNLPGISEMQGGLSLRIEEVPLDQPALIEIDPGIEVQRGSSTYDGTTLDGPTTLFADMSLQMPTPLYARTDAQIDRLLSRPGMFTLEQSEETWTLIHHSREDRLIHTPVERTATGDYMINRPAWPELHQVPFARVIDLYWGLKNMGMKMVGRLPQ